MINKTYLTAPTIISAQKIIENAPSTCSASRGQAVFGIEALAEGVDRTRANIAEHDAECG